MLKLIPELQDMVENESIKASIGYNVWARMPQDEQEKLFNDIGNDKTKILVQKAKQQYIDKNEKFRQLNLQFSRSFIQFLRLSLLNLIDEGFNVGYASVILAKENIAKPI